MTYRSIDFTEKNDLCGFKRDNNQADRNNSQYQKENPKTHPTH